MTLVAASVNSALGRAGLLLMLALAMAFVLGWANRAFHVPVDPKVQVITDVLPGANCGGCGFAGCADFAKAVVEERAPCDGRRTAWGASLGGLLG